MNSEEDFCEPFSVLATICVDMPGMADCRSYTSLCSADSVVQQCTEQAPIPRAPGTMSTQHAIVDACSSHTMEHCRDCPAVGSSCPQTLETMSALCFEMPSMSFCIQHSQFCSATFGAFPMFCDASAGDYLPPMRMYFHLSLRDIILLKDWVPENRAGYTGSFFVIVIMGICLQGIKSFRTLLEAGWYRCIVEQSEAGDCTECTEVGAGCDPACQENCGEKCGTIPRLYRRRAFPFKRNLIRAILTGVTSCLDLLLMLIAMTFNLGLFIAVVMGIALGALLFGHAIETDYAAHGPLSEKMARRPGVGAEAGGCCS